ncbi:MAG: signal peptidase I [Solirubrobacteraceae bacterium]
MSRKGSFQMGDRAAATRAGRRDAGGRPDAGGRGSAPGQEKSFGAKLLELLIIVAVAVGLAFLIQAFIVKPYKIPSGSMEPTLAVGQRVLVDRIGYDFSEPSIGSIVVFHPPEGSGQEICGPTPHVVTVGGAACDAPVPKEDTTTTYIKRVVAGPGDWLYVKGGHVYLSRKGRAGPYRREKDRYITPCGASTECNFTVPIHIPPKHWFMMGDHRGNSDDSRFWGPVPRSWIIGEAFATYWPPSRIGFF